MVSHFLLTSATLATGGGVVETPGRRVLSILVGPRLARSRGVSWRGAGDIVDDRLELGIPMIELVGLLAGAALPIGRLEVLWVAVALWIAGMSRISTAEPMRLYSPSGLHLS